MRTYVFAAYYFVLYCDVDDIDWHVDRSLIYRYNQIDICVWRYQRSIEIPSFICSISSYFLGRTLQVWCNLNHLNIPKFNIVTYITRLFSISLDYQVDGDKGLGVIFDNWFSFNLRTAATTSEVLKILRFIIRCSRDFRNINTVIYDY